MIEISNTKINEVKKKFLSGVSLRKLEKEYGISRKILSTYLKQEGLDFKREYPYSVLLEANKLLDSGISITKTALQLNVDRCQLVKALEREHLIPLGTHTKDFTETPVTIDIKNQYLAGKSISSLASEFSCSTNFIYRIVHYYGISQNDRTVRKYKFNENIFEDIDTEEKAYWLGFLYADGSVGNSNNVSKNTIEITLKESDYEHLQKFSNFINSSPPLPVKPKIVHINNKDLLVYKVTFNSKKIVSDLIAKGCFKSKSLILKFPSVEIIPESLLHHFMRGYFDGDGCLSLIGGKLNFGIVSTAEFCRVYDDILIAKGIVNKTKWSTCGRAFQTRHGSNTQAKKFFNFIYKDATIWLDRKYNKFIAVLGRDA